MLQLEWTEKVVDGTVTFRFKGAVTESTRFPIIKLGDRSEFAIDLAEVTYINSGGTLLWSQWLSGLKKKHPSLIVLIDRCSSAMVNQIISVHGFIPEDAVVRSFFVPFYCENCDQTVDKLYRSDSINAGEVIAELDPSEVECLKCAGKMVLDVIPENYFSVIRCKG